jgi:glycosyltransferase 2 family protein
MASMDKYHGIINVSKWGNSKILRLLIGLLLSVFSLVFSFRNVNITDALSAIRNTDLLFISFAFLAVCISLIIKVLRWKILLQTPGKTIRFLDVLMPFLVAKIINLFIPASLGEASRVFAFRGKKQPPEHAFLVGTLAIEKWLDLFSFALLFLILVFSIQLPHWLGRSGYFFVFITILLTLLLIFTTYRRHWILSAIERIYILLPQRVASFINRHLISGLSSLDIFFNGSITLKLISLSVIIWLIAALINQFMFLALHIRLPFTAPILLMIALQVGISLPSLPASIGVFEFICILTLGFFGIDETTALSFGILLHLIAYLPVIIGGLFSFWIIQLGLSQKKPCQ